MKFFIKDFLSKCDQILSKHLLKKSLMENFIFYAVCTFQSKDPFISLTSYWAILP